MAVGALLAIVSIMQIIAAVPAALRALAAIEPDLDLACLLSQLALDAERGDADAFAEHACDYGDLPIVTEDGTPEQCRARVWIASAVMSATVIEAPKGEPVGGRILRIAARLGVALAA